MDQAAPLAADDPLGHMTEDELLRRAHRAMDRAVSAPEGSTGRAIQWAAYDTVMGELDRRALALAAAATPQMLRQMRAILADAGFFR